jgi:hypothetical protein
MTINSVPKSAAAVRRPLKNLWRQAWDGKYEARGDPGEADCLIAFSFGVVKGEGDAKPRPGAANEDLARLAHEDFPHLPKILQIEVADAYHEAHCPEAKVWIAQNEEEGDPYAHLTTHDVAEHALDVMSGHGWKTAVLLAHAHHVPRVEAVCGRLGLTTVVPPGLERVRFCPDSTQPWTQSEKAWRRREPLVLLYFRLRGWI